MPPDFDRKTIDIVAKRAAFRCTNPDCRVLTVGPSIEATKSTTIGEAAHIRGARRGTARYESDMSDSARAEITNAIWLCRNCHGRIDKDQERYSSTLLFAWREAHEKFVAESLGTTGEKLAYEINDAAVAEFAHYPPIVRRIVMDKPLGWEWRLTAELMRYLNQPHFRKLDDLHGEFYILPSEPVSDEEAIDWIRARVHEMGKFGAPLERLMTRLTASWGPPGEPGNVLEIDHACRLISDALSQVVAHEERVSFVNMSEEFQPLLSLLKNAIGSQALKLRPVPDWLDEAIALATSDYEGTREKPLLLRRTIDFELTENWASDFARELEKLYQPAHLERSRPENRASPAVSIVAIIIICVIIFYIAF